MLAALENRFRLSDRVSILIPDKDNRNQPLSEALLKETVSLVAKVLAEIAGGSTVVPNLKGYYYTEEVSYAKKLQPKSKPTLHQIN